LLPAPATFIQQPSSSTTNSMGFVHSIDGRKYKRVPIVIVVRLMRVQDLPPEAEESTYTDNVSTYGARVISRHSWQPGEEVQVTSVKDGTAIRGRVVYCQQLEAGGFCLGLNFQDRAVPWSSYAKYDSLMGV